MSETPQDFRLQLQIQMASPIPDHPFVSADFQKLTEEQLSTAGIQMPDDPLEVALNLCVERAYSGLSKAECQKVKKVIAFGVAHTGDINAAVYASSAGNYAILLNRGFMVFLNKYLKLSLTQGRPENVLYIDDDAKELIQREGINAVIGFICENYIKYGEPLGGKVKPIPAILAQVAHALHFGETFAICHELGHFFNGDLAESMAAARLTMPMNHIAKLNTRFEHKTEYLADLAGYDIYRKGHITSGRPDDHQVLLAPVVTLFDAFATLDNNESFSHPHPIRRILSIAFHVYGQDVARFWLNSYSDFYEDDFFTEMDAFIDDLSKT